MAHIKGHSETIYWYRHRVKEDMFLLYLLSICIVKIYWKQYRTDNYLLKCANKPFTPHTPPLTSKHLKKAISCIHKNHVKYFTAGIHQNQGYERSTQSIKSSLINIYHRFPLQSFELCGSVTQIIMSAACRATVKVILCDFLCILSRYKKKWK